MESLVDAPTRAPVFQHPFKKKMSLTSGIPEQSGGRWPLTYSASVLQAQPLGYTLPCIREYARQLWAANSGQLSSLSTTYPVNGFETLESGTPHPRGNRDGHPR